MVLLCWFLPHSFFGFPCLLLLYVHLSFSSVSFFWNLETSSSSHYISVNNLPSNYGQDKGDIGLFYSVVWECWSCCVCFLWVVCVVVGFFVFVCGVVFWWGVVCFGWVVFFFLTVENSSFTVLSSEKLKMEHLASQLEQLNVMEPCFPGDG